ncbi:MAG: L-threonylcarbamoyladenylate synthase [Anaerocolumna aminovalerica]|uniref:L-threonylcarbamoyladenylate synthase n=1 Tax=Anaerocolumna aminovalerica TaxID=1527 RepID=UPI00248C3A2C|nr:L-threonylcarbamoyladenylate synthase [Anaerocolumna aminovalerica]MDU6265272.1 L-threonylcarbamoyladenylate synthase [Anaerocolumna aminovalerica]
MKTKIIKLDKNNFNEDELKEASDILRKGGLVAFPTETVYGLGADGLNSEASGKIYAAKGRPSDNPLILHIAHMVSLKELTADCPEAGMKLANAFWPGPLTMIFNKSDRVPYNTTGGLETVAIRMPSHPIAYELIRKSGVYIAAPSANISGRPSPTMAEHVIEDMDGRIEMIVDGGMVDIGLESTIVDVTGEVPTILRPGYITASMLEAVVGPVNFDKAVLARKGDTGIIPKAPGMKYKHYAPKGDLTILEGTTEAVIQAINKYAAEKTSKGFKVGIISTDETLSCYPKGMVKSIGTRKDEDTIARGLFQILREFDDEGAEYIYTESFESKQLGQAIMNRLLKAAGYHIIKVHDNGLATEP